MKKILYILIGLIALLLIGYLIFMNLPQANIKNKDAMTSIAVETLYQEYVSNESNADERYIGKVLEVKGTIVGIIQDESEAPVVLLSNNQQPKVMITLEPNQKSKIAEFKAGDQITVKGQCSGKLIEVVLNKGIIQ